MLQAVHFDMYNEKFGIDGVHEVLEWPECELLVEKFKEDFIFPNMVRGEKEDKRYSLLYCISDCAIDQCIQSMIDWLTHRSIDWLIGWVIHELFDRVFDRLIDWFSIFQNVLCSMLEWLSHLPLHIFGHREHEPERAGGKTHTELGNAQYTIEKFREEAAASSSGDEAVDGFDSGKSKPPKKKLRASDVI